MQSNTLLPRRFRSSARSARLRCGSACPRAMWSPKAMHAARRAGPTFGQFQYLTPPLAVYPEEAINSHRAFITRRRALRPSEEYRTPTDEEWAEFLGHFERRKVSLGTCGRSYATPCIHEHACIRCPLLRPDPAQRTRLIQIRDNLIDRIAEAHHEGWLGEVDGLNVSLAAARNKLAQLDTLAARQRAVHIGMPGKPM